MSDSINNRVSMALDGILLSLFSLISSDPTLSKTKEAQKWLKKVEEAYDPTR